MLLPSRCKQVPGNTPSHRKGQHRGKNDKNKQPLEGVRLPLPSSTKAIIPIKVILKAFLKGYQHLKVNHSINFKDPLTGAHRNTIESTWNALKVVTLLLE